MRNRKPVIKRDDREHGALAVSSFKGNSAGFCSVALLFCLLTSAGRSGTPSSKPDPNSPRRTDSKASSQEVKTPDSLSATAPGRRQREVRLEAATEAASNVGAQTPERHPGGGLFVTESPVTDFGRRVWQVRTAMDETGQDSQGKAELRQLIEQVRSIRFKPQDRTPAAAAVEDPNQQKKPDATLPNQQAANKAAQDAAKVKPVRGPISEETLKTVRAMLKHPEKLENPLDLAEILFRSGYLSEAGTCYEQALNRQDPNEVGSADNGAWIILQMGNCLRAKEPSKAAQMYTRLIEQYPNSMWTDLAKVHSKLAIWYEKEKPETLLESDKK
jgi:tetratricopeptide (TPR) repeat protein